MCKKIAIIGLALLIEGLIFGFPLIFKMIGMIIICCIGFIIFMGVFFLPMIDEKYFLPASIVSFIVGSIAYYFSN